LIICYFFNEKVYIEIIARFKDGTIYPLFIIWHNGQKFTIDKILDIKRAAATNVGGVGVRYTCRINNKVTYIWLDDNLWFVEARKN
jgi:hypothetical protein